MSGKIIFSGTVLDGNLTLHTPTAWKRYLKHQLDNSKVLITIEKDTPKRTLAMNRLYWLYLTVIGNETGNDPEELHEVFKRMFLPQREVTVNDRVYKIAGSTTKLGIGDFSDYVDKISAKTGVPIPETIDYQTAPLKNEVRSVPKK